MSRNGHKCHLGCIISARWFQLVLTLVPIQLGKLLPVASLAAWALAIRSCAVLRGQPGKHSKAYCLIVKVGTSRGLSLIPMCLQSWEKLLRKSQTRRVMGRIG